MKTYNIKDTAGRIRELRASFGYTQETAAELLGVERSYLSRIENGVNGCSVDILVRMTELFDVSLDYLVAGKDVDGKKLKDIIDTVVEQLHTLRNAI